MGQNKKVSRDNNFALLHTLAACMVILGHTFVLLQKAPPYILNTDVNGMGLNILFIISGYLVAKSFCRDSHIGRFYLKRVARLYPSFVVCLIICAMMGVFFTSAPLGDYCLGALKYVADNILMRPRFDLPGVFVQNPFPVSVNGSLWSLPLELALFLFLPFLMMLLKLFKKGRTISAFVLAISLCVLAICIDLNYETTKAVVWGTDWLRMGRLAAFFTMGVAFSTLEMEFVRKWCRADVATLLLCLVLCMGIYYPSWCNYFLLPYFVISFAFADPGISRQFFNQHDYAYGCYLWGFPVQQAIINLLYGKVAISAGCLFGLSLAITVLLAFLTNKLIEEPAQRLTAKVLRRLHQKNS